MEHLRPLFLILALGATPLCLHAADQAAPAGQHLLVGTWSWTLFGGTCTETFQYRKNQTVLATSGQEVSEKKFIAGGSPDSAGFYQVTETVMRHNEKPDCSGITSDGPGEQATRFVQFSPKRDKLLFCQDASLKACFGPLLRMPD